MFVAYPVTCHTSKIIPGGIFVCIAGSKYNGIDFIEEALSKGSKTIVIDSQSTLSVSTQDAIKAAHAHVVIVQDTRETLAKLAAHTAGYPAKKLNIIGVTGTKGKTTIVHMLRHMLTKLGKNIAYLSTTSNGIGSIELKAELTTPGADYVQHFLRRCVHLAVDWVIVEVSAQALVQHRLTGVHFDAAVYTNLSQEHDEFFHGLEPYRLAKERIFTHLKPQGIAILNALDQNSASCAKNIARAYVVDAHTVAPQPYAESLVGFYNHTNAVLAATCLEKLGVVVEVETALKTLRDMPQVPGRAEKYVLKNGAQVYIDYAHSPSSTEAILEALKPLGKKLIVVVGCSGDRDKKKRPLMAVSSATIADRAFITSDNPRSEDPEVILDEMMGGIGKELLHKVVREVDREKAILAACAEADEQTVIAILGKGPDEYIEVNGVKTPFSEKMLIQRYM